MKVLFLDIDGVLNNAPLLERLRHWDVFEPESIKQLNRVLETTGAMIVISSSWRYANTPAMLNDRLMLAGVIPNRVHGETPKTRYERGQEIALWLSDHPEVTEWAAVDDDTLMDPLPSARVVETSWEEGLRRVHADRLIEILGRDP